MDYKEKFEEAKRLYETANTDQRYVLESLFPELKESEDERIKKTLIDYFLTYKEQEECGIETFFGIPTDNILAWLEKQGESYTKRDFDNAFVEGIAFAKDELEKQGEQKPAWSEEDEEELDIAISTLKEAGQHDSAKWLKSLKDRIIPQQKQEWSEEDEKRLQSCLNILQAKGMIGVTDTINTKWLKSLKYQNTWKPSDAQIHAFEQVYDWYNDNFAPSETLTSLYNDLKKLKGE